MGDLALATDSDGNLSLRELAGRKLVLYFYPKDDTPGCTKEGIAFRDTASQFEAAGATIVGVSRDSAAKHDKFKAKYGFPFALIADTDGRLCEAFSVWVEKSMYRRKYMGIERSTFLIDATGSVRRVWRKVKVPGHAEDVLAAVRDL
ncbi:MAG: peroxiredoxin [Rhodospirillales bacterium]|nr:peroxiredoxin [Rhodospirillales bacterium]